MRFITTWQPKSDSYHNSTTEAGVKLLLTICFNELIAILHVFVSAYLNSTKHLFWLLSFPVCVSHLPPALPPRFCILVRSGSCWADRSGNVCSGVGGGGGGGERVRDETENEIGQIRLLDWAISYRLHHLAGAWRHLPLWGTHCHTQACRSERVHTHAHIHTHRHTHSSTHVHKFVWVCQRKCISPNVFSSFQI